MADSRHTGARAGTGDPAAWWFGFPMALLLTCVIEVPAYLGAFWTLGWCRSRPSPFRPLTTRSALALALAVNLISHPLLWMISLRHDRTGQLITTEMCVGVIEGYVDLRRCGAATRD